MEYRGYIIKVAKGTSQYEIRHTGKGSLPNLLSGLFTSTGSAQKVIDSYLVNKTDK